MHIYNLVVLTTALCRQVKCISLFVTWSQDVKMHITHTYMTKHVREQQCGNLPPGSGNKVFPFETTLRNFLLFFFFFSFLSPVYILYCVRGHWRRRRELLVRDWFSTHTHTQKKMLRLNGFQNSKCHPKMNKNEGEANKAMISDTKIVNYTKHETFCWKIYLRILEQTECSSACTVTRQQSSVQPDQSVCWSSQVLQSSRESCLARDFSLSPDCVT